MPANYRDALGEVGRGYIALAALAAIIGFAAQEFLAGLLTAVPTGGNPSTFRVASDWTETWFIFANNAAFFLLVSLLPVVNLAMVAVQFFSLGRLVFLVRELPTDSQVGLLYRHTVFEIVALGAAVAISYLWLFAVREFSDSPERDVRRLGSTLRTAAWLYVPVIACALIGALLEGGAVVQI